MGRSSGPARVFVVPSHYNNKDADRGVAYVLIADRPHGINKEAYRRSNIAVAIQYV